MNALELLGIALAPGVAIMLYIYLKGKHEREPLSLLLASFLYGVFSTLITLSISVPLEFLVTLRKVIPHQHHCNTPGNSDKNQTYHVLRLVMQEQERKCKH